MLFTFDFFLIVFCVFFSYFIGSIPTGYLVARFFGVRDIRKHGSGNIGATNVARILGKHFFVPVFLCDATKAFLNMYVLQLAGVSTGYIVICAAAHLFGNGHSAFLSTLCNKSKRKSIYFFLLLLLVQSFAIIFLQWVISFFMYWPVEITLVMGIFSTLFILDIMSAIPFSGGKGVATSTGLLCALQPMVLPYIFFVWAITFFCTRTVGAASIVGVAALPVASYLVGGESIMLLFSVWVSVWVLVRHKKNIQALLSR